MLPIRRLAVATILMLSASSLTVLTAAPPTGVVLPPPTIVRVSPNQGVVGATVTIRGTGLGNVTNVTFNGVSAGAPVSQTSLMLQVIVPAGATTGKIGVSSLLGSVESPNDFTVLPQINAFSPLSGPSGTQVQITGTSFTGATQVTIGATPAIFTIDSDIQITATVPAGAVTGRIRVTTPGGTAVSASNFIVLRIAGFNPAQGAVGTTVMIRGSGFGNVTDVTFNGVSAGVPVAQSSSRLQVIVPAGATTGKIRVTTPAGIVESVNDFRVLPVITSFTPLSGPPGTLVQVTGTSFTGATQVRFGATQAIFTVDSDTQITATVPAGAVTSRIRVLTPGGTAVSASTFVIAQSQAPTIASFTPTHGPVGTVVTIDGTNLGNVTDATFNGVSASLTPISATQITATVPAGALTGSIRATTPGGTATSATDFVVDAPVTAVLSVDGSGYAPLKDFFNGVYFPAHADYTLTNTGTGPMSWSADVSDPWLTVSPASGTLDPGANVVVQLAIDAAAANALTAAEYTGRVYFSNRSGGTGSTTRPVYLALNGIWPLRVRPAYSFLATGSVQTPPAPATFTYTLTNMNTVISQDWSATSDQSWVQLSSVGGTIPGFQSVDVTATLNPGPNGFPLGTSAATLSFAQFVSPGNPLNPILHTRFVKVIITDDDPPGLTIDAPVTAVMATTLSGTVTDNGTIAAMEWSNARTGQTGSIAVAQGAWTVTIPLFLGTNDVTVTAFDDLGNFSSTTMSVEGTFSPADPGKPEGLPSDTLLERRHQPLKSRIPAQALVVGIAFHPVAVAPAVAERAHVVGKELQRTVGPRDRAIRLPFLQEVQRPERHRAAVEWIERKGVFGATNPIAPPDGRRTCGRCPRAASPR